MGWWFEYGMTKKRLIESLTKNWERDGKKGVCLGRALRGNTLYVAWKYDMPDGSVLKFVAVHLLGVSDGSWGSKDMDEGMGPCECSCPLNLLAMTEPGPTDSGGYGWRNRVRAYHAARKVTLRVGDRFTIPGARPVGPYTLESLRPLRARYNGGIYKIRRSLAARAVLETS